jgi:hypothetical protein
MTYKMTPRGSVRFFDFVQIAIWPKQPPRTCGIAVPGVRVHPFAKKLNGQKLAHIMMRRRTKNIFSGISGATDS